jgi:hypothetical protein
MGRDGLKPAAPPRLLASAILLVLPGLLQGCATTGATYRSGVPDTGFSRPPYVAGVRPLPGRAIVHVPIVFQGGAVLPELFDLRTGDGSPVAALVAEMNAHLVGRGVSVPAGHGATPRGTPPDVRFGCERIPGDECADPDLRTPHRLSVGRPSAAWTAWADSLAEAAGAEHVLVVTLEVGNYLPDQRNLRGDKQVLLGSGHAQDVRWLTALDRPVSVLQVTGALMERGGLATRIAAEGLTARTTHVVLAGLGAQALITDADVERVLTARRDDLPGAPLLWQVALDSLVAALTGSP